MRECIVVVLLLCRFFCLVSCRSRCTASNLIPTVLEFCLLVMTFYSWMDLLFQSAFFNRANSIPTARQFYQHTKAATATKRHWGFHRKDWHQHPPTSQNTVTSPWRQFTYSEQHHKKLQHPCCHPGRTPGMECVAQNGLGLSMVRKRWLDGGWVKSCCVSYRSFLTFYISLICSCRNDRNLRSPRCSIQQTKLFPKAQWVCRKQTGPREMPPLGKRIGRNCFSGEIQRFFISLVCSTFQRNRLLYALAQEISTGYSTKRFGSSVPGPNDGCVSLLFAASIDWKPSWLYKRY